MTDPPKESKRGKALAFGKFLGGAALDLAKDIGHAAHDMGIAAQEKATEAKSSLKERRHSSHTFSEADFVEATHVLHVHLLAASDLRVDKCDSYCSVAIGGYGTEWEQKCMLGCISSRMIAGNRHPQWDQKLLFPIRQLPSNAEFSIQVKDTKTLRSDQVLGEVTIVLEGKASGASCFRLFGGVGGTLSLRWALKSNSEPAPLPEGAPEFEVAYAFWATNVGPEGKAAFSQASLAPALVNKLEGSSPEAANALLFQAPLIDVVRLPEEHSLLGSSNVLSSFTAVLPMLEPHIRAKLALALCEKIDASSVRDGPEHRLLSDIFCTSHGRSLLELKRLIHTGGSCLVRATTNAFADPSRLSKVITHFQHEASLLGPDEHTLHVLSDIDMTLWVGNFGAGGPKFPVGPIPGARPLLRALAAQITFLSARPPLCESQTRRDIFDVGIVEAGLLTGVLQAVLKAAVSKEGNAAMCERKAEAFTEFASLHPEGRFIFIGDSGEGDVDFAEGTFMKGPGSMALIHDVVDKDGIAPMTPATRRAELAEHGIFVFDTYAGAALQLHNKGLLSVDGLQKAAQGCYDEFSSYDAVKYISEAAYQTRLRDIHDDIDHVDAVLQKLGSEPITRNV